MTNQSEVLILASLTLIQCLSTRSSCRTTLSARLCPVNASPRTQALFIWHQWTVKTSGHWPKFLYFAAWLCQQSPIRSSASDSCSQFQRPGPSFKVPFPPVSTCLHPLPTGLTWPQDDAGPPWSSSSLAMEHQELHPWRAAHGCGDQACRGWHR